MHHRAIIIAFLGAILLLKAIIPAGFMPDMGALARGVVRITICSADGADKILVDEKSPGMHHGNHHDGHKNHQAGQDNSFCAFGSAPYAAALTQIFTIALAAFFAAVLFLPFHDRRQVFVRNRATSPRAPPVQA